MHAEDFRTPSPVPRPPRIYFPLYGVITDLSLNLLCDMKRIPIAVLLLCFVLSAGAKTLPIFELTTSKQAVASKVNGTFRFALDPGMLKDAYAQKSFTTSLSRYAFDPADLEGLTDVQLDLTEFSIVGAQTHVIVMTENGEVPGPMPTVRTYRGSVRGIVGSLAVISIDPKGTVSGMVRLTNNTYTLGSNRGELHVAYLTKTSDIENFADLGRCAMYDETQYVKNTKPRTKSGGAAPLAATQSMTMAVDVDKAGNDYFGSQGDATNYITSRFATISAVYEDELDLGITLGRIFIYAVPDPYANSANTDQLLQKFTNHWKNNNANVDRTLAHLFSKQDLDGAGGASGLAWLAGMCRKDIGYGVTRIMGNEGVDDGVIAHEVGHNVGSAHTHNCQQYQPPIDSCVAAEGGCYPGTKQVKGTIMSYCNSKNFTFHPRTRVVMKDEIALAACLGSLAQIQVKTDSVQFGAIVVNATKDTLITALVKNTGTVPLTISSIRIENVEVEDEFYLVGIPALPLVLQPNGTQNITVGFKPAFGGDRFGDLVIAHNATGGQSVIGLHGVGAFPLPIFETELDFGAIETSGNFDTTFLYVENIGDAPLSVSKVQISGVSASEFSIVSGAPPPNISVPANEYGTIVVRFTPTSIGPKNAQLSFTHDGFEPPDNVDIIDLYADVVSLASVKPGNRSLTASLSVTPNPTSEKMTIDIKSEIAGVACQIVLVDQLGRMVAEIASEKLTAEGLHTVWTIDPHIASGTYQLVAKIGGAQLSERVVVLKK